MASKNAVDAAAAAAPPAARRGGRARDAAPERGPAARLMPALPLDEAGKYVAAAYLVFLALVLIYVAIMASKLVRIERELVELTASLPPAEEREPEP